MKSRPFEQLFSVGTGFCMGFLKSSKTDRNPFLFKNRKYKAKAAQIKRFKRLMLELLGRFELPTSSLPKSSRSFYLVSACVSTYRQLSVP